MANATSSPRTSWFIVGCLAMVLAARILCEIDATVCLIEPPHESQLTTTAVWDVPAAGVDGRLTRVPTEYAFCGGGIVLSVLLLLRLRFVTIPDTAAWLCLASVAVCAPHHAITATLIPLTVARGIIGRLTLRLLILAAAVALSLEVGWVCLCCLLLDGVALSGPHKRAATISLLTTLVAIGVMSLTQPGLMAVILRPLSVWSCRHSPLLPHVQSLFAQQRWEVAGIIVVSAGLMLWNEKRVLTARTLAVSLLVVAGLLCGYYAGLAIAGLLAIALQSADSEPASHLMRAGGRAAARGSVLATVLLCAAIVLPQGISSRWTAAQPDIRFNESAPGPVLLGDLSHSQRWKVEDTRLTLILDDRWEVSGEQLRQYDAMIQDLSLGRQEIYKRADGSWGGYRAFLSEHRPRLLVLPSDRDAAIRRVVMDPDWNVCSIDGKAVCFAHATYGSTYRAQRLLKQVMNLEWPNARSTFELDGLINFDRHPDRVARVLVAMRFPNAALRILDQSQSAVPDETVQACWLEIANRTLRQTGQLPVAEVAMLRRQSGAGTSPQVEETLDRWVSGHSRPLSPVAATRAALITGRISDAKTVCATIDETDTRSFLGMFLNDSVTDATELAAQLENASADYSTPLAQAEALCSAGTLYLAAGQPDRALAAFLASRSALNHCYFEGYRELNIRNLFGSP